MSRLIVKRLVQVTVGTLVLAGMLFASSGRIDWVWAWAYLAVSIGVLAINTMIILPRNPELIAERAEAKVNTKSWDRTFTKIAIVPYFAAPLIAGFDVRFRWSPQFPLATQLVALVIVAAGYGLVSWAMVSKGLFESRRIEATRSLPLVHTNTCAIPAMLEC
jgi:hypothetical protein